LDGIGLACGGDAGVDCGVHGSGLLSHFGELIPGLHYTSKRLA
jgi:hypothetical protein